MSFLFNKKKTAEEIQEENDRLEQQEKQEELELSIAQKQALRKRLQDSGLTVKKDFGGSLKKAWTWLNKTS